MKLLVLLLLLGGCQCHLTQSSPPEPSGGGETSVSLVTIKVDGNNGVIMIPLMTNVVISFGPGFVETNKSPNLILIEEPQVPATNKIVFAEEPQVSPPTKIVFVDEPQPRAPIPLVSDGRSRKAKPPSVRGKK